MNNVSERIVQLLNQDDMGGIAYALDEQPPKHMLDKFLPTQFEYDMRNWGLIFGMVFGIIRQEDPWESNYEVAMRALEPAQVAFKAYGDFDLGERIQQEASLSAVGEAQ